ncbi:hypothetical protein SNE40_020279 [Patella caerulea]|uniref:C17orf113 probable zinc finger domain-containing protein n=1 Tax=Patella caerulea TaxID=87958 RepID=A0AAN8GAL3_PATCE
MYCSLCKKHKCSNTQNKSTAFAETPSVTLKKSALQEHLNSKKHISAVETELLNRVSYFQKEVTTKDLVEESVLNKVLIRFIG